MQIRDNCVSFDFQKQKYFFLEKCVTAKTFVKAGSKLLFATCVSRYVLSQNSAISEDMNLTDSAIVRRTEQLIQELKRRNYIYSLLDGVYDGLETSFFVILDKLDRHKTDRKHFLKLGRKFNQDSIIYVRDINQESLIVQQLIYTIGKYENKYIVGKGYQKLSPIDTDNYSTIKLCPNETFKFLFYSHV
ncbi:unnamed protein product [Didymodactylos carnosus]|uniref:Uncharacterized protein n=1 Tax=Didymodactylos carnosus TaxID=1234261 RepID=A0A816AY61_9BILA|nr:unnamed protein product [Didymodactylos carnosus]CAF4478505.1 unnamed protein product [Didymodactylos carnosus]